MSGSVPDPKLIVSDLGPDPRIDIQEFRIRTSDGVKKTRNFRIFWLILGLNGLNL